MLSADKARKIMLDARKEDVKVFREIEKAAEDGKDRVYFGNLLEDSTISKLRNEGYIVENDSSIESFVTVVKW